MAIGDILKSVSGVASLIPGVGSIVGQGMNLLGSILPGDDTDAKKAEEEAKRKAAEEAILKAKQAGSATTDTPQIANPNMALLGQQLQQQGMPPVAGVGGVSGLLNNRRY